MGNKNKTEKNYKEWGVYLGDKASTQYSSLDQINWSNVSKLKVAWKYHTKDKTKRSTIENNPIVIGKTMYITSPSLKVIALNAATGKEIWTYDPGGPRHANRGVTYWENGNDSRILFTRGHYIYALNAKTGRPIDSFGTNGKVDLRKGLDRDTIIKTSISATSPGIIYKNLIILGSRVGEGPEHSSPGHIRAYNIRSGKLTWIFHTIPHPGEIGYDTWPKDAWETAGGANDWGGMSLDEKRGLVFVTTGSPSYQFYGGDRKGNNLFANSVVALNASTGKLIWYFQTVHHDLWDYDNPAPPNLVTIKHNGKNIAAIAQTTKTGFIFVLNRETGKPIYPVEERPVPQSDLQGEEVSKTQPFPISPPPFVRQGLTIDDLTNISEKKNQWAKKQFKLYGPQKMFNPPHKNPGTIVSPGFHGGGWWGGAAYDPTTGMLYVNGNNIPYVISMANTSNIGRQTKARLYSLGKKVFISNCASCHGYDRKGRPPSFPSLLNIKDRLSKDTASSIIKNGQGGMPSFSISQKKKDALLAFLFDEVGQKSEKNNLEQEPIKTIEEGMPPFLHKKYTQFRDNEGYPAVKPPWGTLNAIDLDKGKVMWKVPLGEYEELTKRGISPTGTENEGGPAVTAGGLVFIGATRDQKFRAFDKKTGKILWETTLPNNAFSTPSIYEVNGKEYIVIAVGGNCLYCSEGNHKRIASEEPGDSFIAFTLP